MENRWAVNKMVSGIQGTTREADSMIISRFQDSNLMENGNN